MKRPKGPRIRPWTQGAFLLLFLFLLLQTTYRGEDQIPYPVNLFLRFDPLVLLSTLLGTWEVPWTLLLSLTVVAMALLVGRAFCGWICPLGTLNHLLSRWTPSRPSSAPWKYWLLLGLLATSLLGIQVVGFLDPLSLLIRSLTLAAEPLWNLAGHGLFAALYDLGVRGLEPLYTFLKEHVLALRQPLYHQALWIGLIFAVLLLLNLLKPRLWCTHLCPLGALLGLLARLSPMRRRVSEACKACGLCQKACPSGAATPEGGRWKASECLLCLRCQDLCPLGAVSFGFSFRGKEAVEGVDLSRRAFLASVGGGVLLGGLLLAEAYPQRGRTFLRPPGALPEDEFLERCVRCGECMKVCLTGTIQPAGLSTGLRGLWTPVLDFNLGYCHFSCTLCGQVCPTGAIRELGLDEKVRTRIGLAHIDRSRCIPWQKGVECIVCEEHCPTSPKAVKFVNGEVDTPQGRKGVRLPVVDYGLCIGCGICQFKCPLEDRPAIVVTPFGESRSGGALLPP